MQHYIKKMQDHYGRDKIVFPILVGNIFYSWKQICHFKSEGNYCRMITSDGQQYFVTKSLKWVEQQLVDTCFYRIHKGYLINIYHIEQFNNSGDGTIIMKSGLSVPISRLKKQEFRFLMNCS